VSNQFSELHLDALREVGNIGSGTAATALAGMLGRPVDLTVPSAAALPLAEAVEAAGPATDPTAAVILPVFGELNALVLLLFRPEHASALCALLGVEGDPEMELSCLGEIGNILGTSYVGALQAMTGIELEPAPPQTINDMLGAIVASALAVEAAESDLALMLDSQLVVEGTECTFNFIFVPGAGGVTQVLTRLGLDVAA
jgi:chemotaxis protein CheC